MLIIGHRGASGTCAEHTARAMRAALAQGADGIECDVRLTADGHLVCLHDPVLDRVSNGTGRVSSHTLAQLRELNIGDDTVEPVLTFAELLDIYEAYPGAHLFVETKHPTRFGGRVERALVRMLTARGLASSPRVHIISFSPWSLWRVRRLAPQLDVIWLHRDLLWPVSAVLHRWVPFGYGANIDVIARRSAALRSIDGPRYCYTANTREQILAAAQAGMAYLATDFPADAARILTAGDTTGAHEE
ncbi:glycerophosphodiester phosphodiesterase family protein [Corynebacterium sp. 13CS0277]|uniref:glycerophosphodiester phosphodiesterase n=1 Tax=Corynebacterium sp. 13CS0277 TaxID=2071994 RepID=UPI0013049390|nr:glycerophosphodiester phosphodiesterase family protein [Corynebacterium sp. 13CS0277]